MAVEWGASTFYGQAFTPLVAPSDVPVSVMTDYWRPVVANNKGLFAFATGVNDVWDLQANGSHIRGTVLSSSPPSSALILDYVNGFQALVWHTASWFATAATVGMWLDGFKTTISPGILPASISYTQVGASVGFSRYWAGRMANFAIWKGYQLTDQDGEALEAGAHPYTIGRGKLAHFFPMRGETPAVDIKDCVGGDHLLRNGANGTKAEEQPKRRRNGFVGCF